MPKDFLIRYRDCVFLARKGGHWDIVLISNASEPYAFTFFNPKEGDVVIDVGAHCGKYAVPSGKLVKKTGRVIAFEPIPETHKALKRNIALNELSNVIPLQLATYSENRPMWLVGWNLKFHPEPHPATSGNPRGCVQVEAVTVDSVLQKLGIETVDYVKIDVNGGSVDTLKGMSKTLSESPLCKILIEVTADDEKEVEKILSCMGFRAKQIDSFGNTKMFYYVKDVRVDAYLSNYNGL